MSGAMRQDVQRNCGCLIISSGQGKTGHGFENADLVKISMSVAGMLN